MKPIVMHPAAEAEMRAAAGFCHETNVVGATGQTDMPCGLYFCGRARLNGGASSGI